MPYDYDVSTGIIIPDSSDILAQVQDEWRQAFGQDLDVDSSTYQGTQIAMEVVARTSVLAFNAANANQFNPNISGGIDLDAILALTGAQRNSAQATLVTCRLTGVSGTVVQIGVQARSPTLDVIFESTVQATIVDPYVEVVFKSVIPGTFQVAPNTVTQILSTVLGWETINNPSAGTPGNLPQSDVAARALRAVTLAINAGSTVEAILSALNQRQDVVDTLGEENVTDETITIDDVDLVPHSIYINVLGDISDNDVAAVITSRKGGGCNYNGEITVPYLDPISQQVYEVQFSRPVAVPIVAQVTVSIGAYQGDVTSAVRTAIVSYANGGISGDQGLKIGKPVSAFEFSGAINYFYPAIYVKLVETSVAADVDYSSNEIPIKISEVATITADGITVIIV